MQALWPGQKCKLDLAAPQRPRLRDFGGGAGDVCYLEDGGERVPQKLRNYRLKWSDGSIGN